ncbi:cystinosin [Nesidiocoris tenuis]|uniref:Cystinosin n=1 Tax=Nesidiocoris tenuis TaxID=355587 RepID=A0ABN7B7H2_9HEMI|nr:cystinosin [Nesidiocoris tenuis]
MRRLALLIFASVLLGYCYGAATKVYTDVQEITLVENQTRVIVFNAEQAVPGVVVSIVGNHGGVVAVEPSTLDLSLPPPWNVTLRGKHRGHDTIYANITSNISNVNVDSAFVVVTVAWSLDLELVSTVVGWIYFVAWSVSFYPQCFQNWRRKSVVGLNFDFLALNLIGFVLYSLFNCGLYWGTEIQKEYFAEHPRGLNPVLLNDVVFSLHAVCITLVTIGQCFIYENGGQRVSRIATGIISILLLIFAISLVLPFFAVINWLMFLYICSYIKLAITLMKYVPQAFMNYKRQSTIGWSIHNVILDFTGGMLSMMQMIINADNYDDWNSIFGDPTKFGLGLFSVLFDILFLVQHYVLYRNPSGNIYDLSTKI